MATAAARGRALVRHTVTSSHVALWLEEVRHFIEDVLVPECCPLSLAGNGDCPWLPWLLRVAQARPDSLVTGAETEGWAALQDDEDEAAIIDLSSRIVVVFGGDPYFAVVPEPTAREFQLLQGLESLAFNCKGGIRALRFEGPDPERAWSYAYEHLLPALSRQELEQEPQWALSPQHGPLAGKRPVFSRVARVFAAARSAGRMFLFVLRDDFHDVWGVPGGGVQRGPNGDRCFLDTAQREWNEEIPCNPWDDSVSPEGSLLFPVSKANSPNWTSSNNFCEPDISREGVSSTVWVFLPATEAFFLESEWHCIGRQLYSLAEPEGKEIVYMCDAREHMRRIHTHGAHLMEHTVGTWLELEHATGDLLAPAPGLRARADFALLFKSRPPDVWRFLEALPEIDVGFGTLPAYRHRSPLSTVGVREKLAVYRANYPNLRPAGAMELLKQALTLRDGGPYDAELFQHCLERGLSARLRLQGQSLLYWVLSHKATRSPVVIRAAGLLMRAGAEVGPEEAAAIEARIEQEEDGDCVSQWRSLAEGRVPEVTRRKRKASET